MSKNLNPMQIYQLLNQSNCRECGEPTCMAFAASVFKGHKQLSACPYVDKETLNKYSDLEPARTGTEENMQQAMHYLQQKIPETDLAEAARRTGGIFENQKLTLQIMGKNFSVDTKGGLDSEIHVNPWVSIPVLQYILHGKGKEPTGNWAPFKELPHGRPRAGLFEQRCEKPLKRVADNYPDLFYDILDLFDAMEVDKGFRADVSFLLYPLPRLPMIIAWWYPAEDLESALHIFFDETAKDNLGVDGVFALGTGLAMMVEKLALRHGVKGFIPL
ncbi:Fe-S cluster domain protein [Desulfonatronospira thiodismutans ASO3-1]|uniref:Fe-S cluster domain protein n=1 Tax=Desulfonatronospira thiodismutans ASO3-1 TaxID=555779 RepID=D6SM96_9BACT|nr:MULTISPECIES: DUF3786 domain-containing protein [Desulfonatronospira]EFI35807.1 Fe-S cluster domain protein [Desulfonatronospira thiodismutans ASO3-1]RQD78116.1 MAG: DUF3786 domain-containing protein [Desulfonatronospira sp. MSAO_Bac3]